MIAIGNNEKCPYCDLIMTDFKIDGVKIIEHMKTKHKEQFLKDLGF